MAIRVEKLAGALGARITHVDMSSDLDDAAIVAIAAALEQHGVLTFADQEITDADHVRFASRFGKLEVFSSGSDEGSAPPEIFRSANLDAAGNLLAPQGLSASLLKLNWLWHTDASYRPSPTKGVILRNIEGAAEGGQTLFANMAAAYAALPATKQERIAKLIARHSFEYMVRTQGLPALAPEELAALPAAEHPIVRHHSGGRRSLFLSPPYMECIVGWNHTESSDLIAELTEWSTQSRFIFEHEWRPGDVVMWDNQWTMHKVAPYDLGSVRRVVRGCVLID